MSSRSEDGSVKVLLVEDNPVDVLLMQEALKRTSLDINVSVVGDGAAALAFLHRQEAYANVSRPDFGFYRCRGATKRISPPYTDRDSASSG